MFEEFKVKTRFINGQYFPSTIWNIRLYSKSYSFFYYFPCEETKQKAILTWSPLLQKHFKNGGERFFLEIR